MTQPHASRILGITLFFAVVVGCSFVLDKKRDQCSTDADCLAFGGHPTCTDGVCVPSGLGPPGCFFGQPSTPDQFASQCTTAQCIPFDNCTRLGICGADAGVFGINVTPVNVGSTPPVVNPEMPPTVNCADPARPNVIYVTGSTNLPPLIQAVQPLLYADSPPYTVVFQPQTSKAGAASIYDNTKNLIKDIQGNWAYFYDSTGTQTLCLLADGGTPVDVGESDVFPQAFGYQEVAGIADYRGPVQAVTFVVPAGSSQVSISAEAAHLVFGTGGDNGSAAPWTDPTLYFIRGSGTGTVQLPSYAIGVSPSQWWGIDRLSAANLRDSMESIDPSVAEKAIGILSNDFADRSRANLVVLAFQQQGQSCGYLPDSTIDSFDKKNVRDGHYFIWGTIHLFAPTVNGVPSQAASALVTRFTVPKLDQSLVAAIITAGFVPPCAMNVQRSVEMGPLSAYQPQFGCGCFYENAINGSSACQACTGPGECPASAPACNYGFCEAR